MHEKPIRESLAELELRLKIQRLSLSAFKDGGKPALEETIVGISIDLVSLADMASLITNLV